MKVAILFLTSFIIMACATNYTRDAETANTKKLCMNLSESWLYNKVEGHAVTLKEIKRRNINKDECKNYADIKLQEIEPNWKLNLCQQVAKQYYVGNYQTYKQYLNNITRLGYADEECKTIGEFYVRKVKRSEARSARFSAQFNAAMQSINHPGSYFNPIDVRVVH